MDYRQSDEKRQKTEMHLRMTGAEKCCCCGIWMSKEYLREVPNLGLVCSDCIVKDY